MNEGLIGRFEEAFNCKVIPMKSVSMLKPEIQKIWDFIDNLNPLEYNSTEIVSEILEHIVGNAEYFDKTLTTMSDLYVKVGLREKLKKQTSLEDIKNIIEEAYHIDILTETKKLSFVRLRNVFCYISVKKEGYTSAEVGNFLSKNRSTVTKGCRLVEESFTINSNEYTELLGIITKKLENHKLKN